MGKGSVKRKDATLLVREEGDGFRPALSVTSGTDMVEVGWDSMLDNAIDALYEKRGSTREKALAEIIEGFNRHVHIEFVEKQFITLLHQCLSCIKRGSIREIALASHVIGMLALIVGCGKNANEIYEESLPHILEAFKSGMEASKLAVLVECLAIVSFVGGNDPSETMQVMMQLIRPKLGPNVVGVKLSPALITAVVTAWAFVLTGIDENSCGLKKWQETVSYLSMLLDKDNRSLRIATGEALVIIFEKGILDQYSLEAKKSNDSVCGSSHIHELKGKIDNQIRSLSMEAGGRSNGKKDLSNQRNLFRNILAYVEDGCSPRTSLKIGKDTLSTSTWSQLIQLNYLKHFLGGGFMKHMQDNDYIQDVVGFVPKQVHISRAISQMSNSEKRLYKSPNSAVSKARTQQLNKQRLMSQSTNSGRFAVGMEDD